jgi:hypothetical protein
MEEGGEFTFAATPQPRTSPRRAAAAAAAAAAPPSLADVPDNIPVTISAFLRCHADRVHLACVNRLWSRALRGVGRPPPPVLRPLPALPPQLPWLIFPNTETPTFYSPITRRYHRLLRLPPDVRRARFCGSADGGWLVLALDSCNGYALYNLNSGQRIPLPPSFRNRRNVQFPLVVRAVTLSAPPSLGVPYMIGAIVLAAEGYTAAFWTPGSDAWYSPGGLRYMRPQDVIFHLGAFIFVGADERVAMFWPFHGPEGDVAFGRVEYDMTQREDYAEDLDFVHGGLGTMSRYLVASRGRLLMVVRYIYEDGTLTLRVFGFLVTAGAMADGTPPRAIWENLGNQLDGRMLFLGRGCTRSLEVADYNGFEESVIYFLDERMASEPSPDGRSRMYSFTDMGRYDLEGIDAAPWPEGIYPSWSDIAPPTWWLH